MNSKNLDTLPEEIRSHILSLMPTKFAVQTSILSKSWRYSWTLVTNLDFDDTHSSTHDGGLDSFVYRVLKFYKASKLNLFRLRFGVKKRNVSNWIDEAVKLNVRELDIRVHDLPLSMFTCTTLTMLRLDHVDSIWECPSRVSLPCLKTLDIIVYSNPFVNAFKLIPGCPVLESLSLQVDSCKGEQHYIFSIPTLKRLKLTMTKTVPVFHKVVLHLPILEYLYVGGCLSSLFVMEDLPALVEASISTKSSSTSHLWFQLLKGISGVKSLSILDEFLVAHVWSLVETGIEQPTVGIAQSDTQRKKLEGLCMKDQKVKHYLYQVIDRVTFEQILGRRSTKAVLESMKKRYEGNARVKKSMLQKLRRDFEVLEMKSGEGIPVYSGRVLTVANQIRSNREVMTDANC